MFPGSKTFDARAVLDCIEHIANGNFSELLRLQGGMPIAFQRALTRLASSMQKHADAAGRAGERDPICGLLTRSSFRDHCVQRLVRDGRPEPAALLFIDLDEMKHVNDGLGYAAGDQLLALAATRMQLALDAVHGAAADDMPKPILSRLGADEFGVFAEGASAAEGTRYAQAVLTVLREPYFFKNRHIVVTASIGIVAEPGKDRSFEQLLLAAEMAMAEVKAAGRNGCAVYHDDMGMRSRDRAIDVAMLRRALAEDQFRLVFQPQFRVEDGEGEPAAEALLRWHHPERGIVMPDAFIPVAEQSGLIHDLGRWTLTAAIKTIARWQQEGTPCRVAVNISAVELTRPDLVDHVREWLRRTGASPSLLEIEVTETVMAESDALSCQQLAALRALGITIAIDDFGAGYSNLSRLSRLPIDRLKIDRSLSGGILEGASQREILVCIIGLAKILGHEIVVEGIENSDQADAFAALGCDLLQGFYLSRPLSEPDFSQWLQKPHASRPLVRAR